MSVMQRIGYRLAVARQPESLEAGRQAILPALAAIDIGGFVMSTSRKFRNVADNGRVAFVVDDIPSTDPWRVRCLDIRGVAEAIAEPNGVRKTADNDPAIIRVHPRRIIALGIEDPDVEPHDLVPNARTIR